MALHSGALVVALRLSSFGTWDPENRLRCLAAYGILIPQARDRTYIHYMFCPPPHTSFLHPFWELLIQRGGAMRTVITPGPTVCAPRRGTQLYQ